MLIVFLQKNFQFLAERTRVKLSELPGEPGSDYMNGNYIDGLIAGKF